MMVMPSSSRASSRDTSIRESVQRHWPLLAAVILYWAGIAIPLGTALSLTAGHFIYPLDDPYISMAMAANFADHGVWGITRYAFTSSSSSLLWPLVLAASDKLTQSRDLVPLVWNIIIGTVLIVLVDRLLQARGLTPSQRFAGLVFIVLMTPLPLLSLIGLEHTLHVLLTIVVALLLARQLSGDASRVPHRPSLSLALAVMLLVMTRYEGLFLVLTGCILAAIRRRWLYAITLGMAALVPVMVYGALSVSHGWAPLPNPILLKGNVTYLFAILSQSPPFSASFVQSLVRLLGVEAIRNIMYVPEVAFVPVLVILPMLLRPDNESGTWGTRRNLELLFLGTFVLHAEFGSTGWLFRYEAYLVAFAIFVVAWGGRWLQGLTLRGPNRGPKPIRKIVFITLLVIAALALFRRSTVGVVRAVEGSKNVYEQQYQMGLFLRGFYQGEHVTAQDVGAINYLADIRCVDIMGLASMEPLAMSLVYSFERHVVDRWSGGQGIAVLYKKTLETRGGIPPRWVEAGEWTIQHNVVAGGPTVTFYSVDPSGTERLVASLRRFSPRLPPTVIQDGLYTHD